MNWLQRKILGSTLDAVVSRIEETYWKQMALYRIVMESGTIGPKDAIELMAIESKDDFTQWMQRREERMPDEYKKIMQEIRNLKKEGEVK